MAVELTPQKFAVFSELSENLTRNTDDISTINAIGDFNMKSTTNLEYYYNKCVERYMAKKYHLHQIIYENTTNDNSKLDLGFLNITLEYSVI